MHSLRKLKDPTKGRVRSQIWLKQAEFDLEASKVSFDNKFYEWSAYQSEQAVEKSLKSVILNSGFIPPKIHKLAVLMGYCNRLNPAFKGTRFDFRDLDSFTFISRYPFIIPGRHITPHDQIKKSDATRLLEQSKDFVSKIRYILEHQTPVDDKKSQAYDFEISKDDLQNRLDNIVDIIVDNFAVEKIVLFGTYSKQFIPKSATTIDLLIIADTDEPFLERIKNARDITKGQQPSIEPLVYTPDEFKYMTEEEGEGLLEIAVTEGKILYDKDLGKMVHKLKF